MFTDCLQACLQTVYRLFKGMFTDCLETVYRHVYRLFTSMFTDMFTDCLQTVSGMKVLQFSLVFMPIYIMFSPKIT